jgi:hypothetical protein
MADKIELLGKVKKLLELASNRNTSQGLKIYEGALKKIGDASTQNEIDDLVKKLDHALSGIEAHGHFTNEEYEVVKEIRQL